MLSGYPVIGSGSYLFNCFLTLKLPTPALNHQCPDTNSKLLGMMLLKKKKKKRSVNRKGFWCKSFAP